MATSLTGPVLITGFLLFGISSKKHAPPARSPANNAHTIHTLLSAWANDPDQTYPDIPSDANANFRVLFEDGLTKDESVFGIDGWCDEGKPDGDIGQAPDFAKALESWELSYAYQGELSNTLTRPNWGPPSACHGTVLRQVSSMVPSGNTTAFTGAAGISQVLRSLENWTVVRMDEGTSRRMKVRFR